MAAISLNLNEQIKKQTEKLAQIIAKAEAEKNAAAVKKAAADASKKARLETLKAEKKRIADKNAKAETKALFSKRAHIFFRLISKNSKFGNDWVLKVLTGCGASEEVKKVFMNDKAENSKTSS